MDGSGTRLTQAIVRKTLARGGFGDELNLSTYTHIDDEAAAALARFEDRLILDGLVEISEDAAVYLGHHEGYLLSLGGLREFPVSVAEALAKHDGCLGLNGLLSLSMPCALALATQRGELELNGLTELSPAVSAVLVTHRATPHYYPHSLSLNGLITISDEAASALARYTGTLSLLGLKTLSDAAAGALARCPDSLSFPGLTMLSEAAAKALAEHQGSLFLDGLTTLSDAAASALAQHQGDLSLNGLTTVSDTTAKALALHQGSLSLYGLRQFSVETMMSLAAHRGPLRGGDEIRELSNMRPSDEQLAKPLGESWFMSPDGRLSQDDCSSWHAYVLETYIRHLMASPRHEQLVAAHRLADRLCVFSGFTGLTYAMHPWAPAYRCQMLAAVVRWLVDLGDKARAEQVLCHGVWGFSQRSWTDKSWVSTAIREWLLSYRSLFGPTGDALNYAREQGWSRPHLATLESDFAARPRPVYVSGGYN